MYRAIWLLALSVLLLLSGCGGDNTDVATELNINRVGFNAKFDPGAGVIPFPNNLLYGSPDATLNIPPTDPLNPTDIADPKVAMNALDGFSTVAPFSTTFGGAIDGTTLGPSTVRVFEVTLSTLGGTRPVGGPVSGLVGELVYGSDFVASISTVDPAVPPPGYVSGSTLVILPLKPLKPRSHYLVALTSGIKNTTGVSAGADAIYVITKSTNPLHIGGVNQVSAITDDPDLSVPGAQTADEKAVALDPLRQLVNAQEAVLTAAGVDTHSVVLSWTFSTQSVGNVLRTVNAVVKGSPPPVSALAGPIPGTPLTAADLYAGTLEVPYYLTVAADNHDIAPLGTWWHALNPAFVGDTEKNLTFLNPLPETSGIGNGTVAGTEKIPLLVSVPKTAKPTTGVWPVVIFQHGITQNRTNLLAVADALAGAGFAAVAIDMPLHGLTGNETNGTAGFRIPGLERTFDLDLVDNDTGAPGPDGNIDLSATHFINLASLLTTRDNLRQAVADLFTLNAALATMDYDTGGPDFDTNNTYFVGHSLGGIVGSTFLALEPGVKAAVLGMPGGGIAKLLDGSASFGPRIAAGLAAKGVDKGTADFESFLGAAQTLIDSGDPINYAADVGVGRGVLLFEVIDDQVVPNNVMADAPVGTVPSPLAGTDPLAAFMGLTPVSATTTGTDLHAQLRFISGDHSSILDPTGDAVVTTVMQNAMAKFLLNDGGLVDLIPGAASVLE